ncbi:MAG TPA: hypothetical protein VNR62_06245, partial [Cellulomonas sp.]|nr:hypothetical protein [Cellulomonas sp.]
MTSVDSRLRLAALSWRVQRRAHTDDDLIIGLELAGSDALTPFDRRDELGALLVDGWPGDDRLKRAAQHALHPAGGIDLNREIAAFVLIVGFGHDDDVVSWITRELRQDYAFSAAGEVFELLSIHCRGIPALVAALDTWMPAQRFNVPEVCFAALVGRTPTAKRVVLDLLADPEGASAAWPFRSLLDGWGATDPEAASALRACALGPVRQAGEVANLLSSVLRDDDERRHRLLELVQHPDNRRPELALAALAGEQDATVREAAFEAAWRRHDDRSYHRTTPVRAALIAHYPEDPRVVELALESIHDVMPPLEAVTRAAVHHPALRERLHDVLVPLPEFLRVRFAQRVLDGAGQTRAARLLADWHDEDAGQAAVAAATAYVARADIDDEPALVARAADGLFATAFDKPVAAASLAALLELGRLDRFATAVWPRGDLGPLSISFNDGPSINWWLAWRVVVHWEQIFAALGDEAPKR